MITKKQIYGGKAMLDSVYPMIALAFILIACVELCDAASVVDVYRLIQYDISGVPLGSRLSSMNQHAASSQLLIPPSTADLSRSVLLLPLSELSNASSALKDYVDKGKQLGGLLLLLPQIINFDASPNELDGQTIEEIEAMKVAIDDVELLLLRSNIPYPVYFAFEDEHLLALLSDVKKHDAMGQPATATTGGYKLVVSTAEPKKVLNPIITNIQGWLSGRKAYKNRDQLPTIAVVASYDTFGSVPALSVGSSSSGSGVVALLEIARLFSLLYSNSQTRGRYNILFGLTSGGPYNYNGTLKWLRALDQRVRESIEFAVCLDSVGSWDKDLWLHVSKSPENAVVKQILEEFSDVAKELDVEISLKHKKINISNTRVAWEHEQFSRMRITAATLSGHSSAPEMLENNGNIFDSRYFVREESVIRTANLVSETIARHIYGLQGKNVSIISGDGSISVNSYNIKSWLDFLSRTPRVAPFLSKNDPLVSALHKELVDHTEDVALQHDSLNGIFTFYDSTKAQLNVYQVASVTFDLLLLLAVGSYLIVLFFFLLITTRGLDDLIGLFRRPPSRKVKTA